MNLNDLALPFPAEDIEWRVSRSGNGKKGIFCFVLAYITARAIQRRLDDVCGAANWQIAEPKTVELNGKNAFVVGISIRIGQEWVTKWDAADTTNIEPAKGAFSGAMKRAGAQWGIGRYLYALEETYAETADEVAKGSRDWHYAKLPEKHGGSAYYWKTPELPAWALPKEKEHEISDKELSALKQSWRAKFAPDTKSPKALGDGFSQFVLSVVGQCPIGDASLWTREALERCQERINATTDPKGVSPDVPFDK